VSEQSDKFVRNEFGRRKRPKGEWLDATNQFFVTPQKIVFLVLSDNVGGLFLWFVSFGQTKEMNALRQLYIN